MSVYLKDIPLEVALQRFESALKEMGLWKILEAEEIPLDENALGRVLAAPVWAKLSSPHYHASAMDGFAVHAEETHGAQPSTPIILKFGVSAVYLDTGDPLPSGFNAVIPIENTEPLEASGELSLNIRNPDSIRIRASVAPWSHIRPLGEDYVATQLVLPEGQVLRPVDLGAIAASGNTAIMVARKPRVAILPTGSELVPLGTNLGPGDIPEFNSLFMSAQVNMMGAEATRFQITEDNFEKIKDRVLAAAKDFDLILLNAGSSAGSEDFSSRVVESLGNLFVHGVAVRPGHPVILGLINPEGQNSASIEKPVPISGVPGYPVSAALTVEIFVEPIIARWLGRSVRDLAKENAILSRKIVSPAGDDDFVRVVVGQVDGKLLAAPLSRGAGVISSLARADGLIVIPRGVQGYEAGESVQVQMYRTKHEVESTIFCIGSHDMTLDLLAQHLAKRDRRLVSSNVGSQGGLIAVHRREAHLAGSHLFDPATGEFNISSIKQYVPDRSVKLIAFVYREQGLMVPKGNPHGLSGLKDIAEKQVRMVNRQRGSGTRVLFDYNLKKLGLSPDSFLGYDDEEYTHLGVAAAVASGRADTGLGITAAAVALHLDFVPLFSERYDLVIPVEYFEDDLLKPLLEVVSGNEFQKEVSALPGYDVSKMGEVIAELEAA
jgi:putative molybdopterin biosynthesis protein